MANSAEALCKYNAPEFCKFTEAVLEMKFDEDPKYAALIALFEPILAGCVHKPICVDSAIKVHLISAVALLEEDTLFGCCIGKDMGCLTSQCNSLYQILKCC